MSVENLTGQIFGQYELRESLGAGGMGAVYRAYQANLKREVAVKVLPPSLAQQPGYIERFNREAEVSAALEHSHIVSIYDYGAQRNITYVVMRLLTGGSLTQRLHESVTDKRPLPSLTETAELLKQLGSALDYAHSRGVIHRDIKPSNIMFDNQGNAFLVDFGIAKLISATTSLTGTGVAGIGTPSYMPPEQWQSQPLTPAADQYALAVVAYAMLTGRLPFEADTPFQLMHKHLYEKPTPPQNWRGELPKAMDLVLGRALAKNPQERFSTVTAFAQAFSSAIVGIPEETTGFFQFRLRPSASRGDSSGSGTGRRSTTGIPPRRSSAGFWVLGGLIVVGIGAVLVAAASGLFGGLAGPTASPTPSNVPVEVVVAQTLTALAPGVPTATETPAQQSTRPIVLLTTDTHTPIPSDTSIPLSTSTATETATFTVTPAPTATDTPLPSDTVVPTSTLTHTATNTPTNTPTSEPTATSTPPPTVSGPPTLQVGPIGVTVYAEPFIGSARVMSIADQTLPITGVTGRRDFVRIYSDGQEGWVQTEHLSVQVRGDLGAVPMIRFTATATPTSLPELSETVLRIPDALGASIYAEPTVNSTRFALVNDITLPVIGMVETDDAIFYQVIYEGQEGWVREGGGRTLEGDVDSIPVSTAVPLFDDTAVLRISPVFGASIYSEPTSDSAWLAAVSDIELPITGLIETEDGNFYQVVYEGDVGWVQAGVGRFLEGDIDSIPILTAERIELRIGGLGVHVLSEPTVSATRLATVDNVTIPITGRIETEEDVFFRVDYEGRIAWVRETIGLRIQGDEERIPEVSSDAPFIQVGTFIGLNVYRGLRSSSGILAHVEGRDLFILGVSPNGEHYLVSIDGQQGWVSAIAFDVEVRGDVSNLPVIDGTATDPGN